MKKILLSIFGFFACTSISHAIMAEEFNYVPYSSFTDAATAGPILFTSATIKFVGITVSSPAPNGYIALFRSTSPTFLSDQATQTVVGMDHSPSGPDVFIPLFLTTNSSYTYISKSGTGQATIWFFCRPNSKSGQSNVPVQGLCPGLPISGQRSLRMEPYGN